MNWDALKSIKKDSKRFALISDVHITQIGEGCIAFEKTMKALSNLDVDAYIFVGDLTYMIEKAGGGTAEKLYPKAYDLAFDIINKYVKDTPTIYTIGNHEFPQHNNEEEICAQSIELFEERTGHKINEHVVLFGYHFITIGANNYDATISKENENWAKQEIDKAICADNDKPVFVVYHKPPHGTVLGSQNEPEHMSCEFFSYLNSNPRIINIVGDLHIPVQEPKSIWQDGTTVVHCPMAAVGNIVFGGCTRKEISTNEDFSQAIVMDVKDNVVTMHRLDTIEEKVVADSWIIDVNDKQNWKYTKARFDAQIYPYFADDAALHAKYENGILSLQVQDAMCEENNIEAFAEYYDIKVSDNSGKEILSERIQSDFYLAKRSGYFKYSKDITLSGEYTIEITPVSSFYKAGKSITAKINA